MGGRQLSLRGYEDFLYRHPLFSCVESRKRTSVNGRTVFGERKNIPPKNKIPYSFNFPVYFNIRNGVSELSNVVSDGPKMASSAV